MKERCDKDSTTCQFPVVSDWCIAVGLMIFGFLSRILWWSGYGLADDPNFRYAIEAVLNGGVASNSYSYRVTWWLPTALVCRIFGVSETSLIIPITVISTLGIGLIYIFGKVHLGRAAGLFAALLLLVLPVDFAWSTMFANDFFLSFFAAMGMLCFLCATNVKSSIWNRRLYFYSALSLFFAYHAKLSAAALAPAIAIISWWRRKHLFPDVTTFIGVALLLFGIDMLASYAMTGSLISPYKTEMQMAGLIGSVAKEFHRFTEAEFWIYPRILFATNHLGNMLYSLCPHMLIIFVFLKWPLRLSSSKELWVWFLAVFFTIQFQMTRVDDVWVSVFRNVRHSHVLVYPLVLLLGAYFASFRQRNAPLAYGLFAALFLFSGWQSLSVASKTRSSFADCRKVSEFLYQLPRKSTYSDSQLRMWTQLVSVVNSSREEIPFQELNPDPNQRKMQIHNITSGYLVTGGGREPYYGCYDCIPSASELPADRWHLLKEFPLLEDPKPWRKEPVRIWEAAPTAP